MPNQVQFNFSLFGSDAQFAAFRAGAVRLIAELGLYPEHERPCPSARRIREHALYVPVHARLTPRQLARVTRAVVRRLGPVVAAARLPRLTQLSGQTREGRMRGTGSQRSRPGVRP